MQALFIFSSEALWTATPFPVLWCSDLQASVFCPDGRIWRSTSYRMVKCGLLGQSRGWYHVSPSDESLSNRMQEPWLRILVVGSVVGCSLRPRYFLVDMPACLLVFLPGGEFPEQWARRKLEELSITTSDKDSSKEES